MTLRELANELSDMFSIASFGSADSSLNGLQVGDLDKGVNRMAFAVDASLASIRGAAEWGADVLFVHHGLFWGSPLAVTGRHYQRVSTLIKSNVALFACHLPLDANADYGNNAQIAKRLGLEDVQPFAPFRGVNVGFKGVLPAAMTDSEIVDRLGVRTNPTNFAINCKGRRFSRIGVVSGDGAVDVYEAMDNGLDLLITGESMYSTVNDCLEDDMSMLCLGHYETETFGVRAVMDMVSEKYGFETTFIDIPLGL